MTNFEVQQLAGAMLGAVIAVVVVNIVKLRTSNTDL